MNKNEGSVLKFFLERQKMKDKKKEYLFEAAPIPKAVMTLAIPTVISAIVMVLYNLADT